MERIHKLRGYEYDLRVGQWTGDFPSVFRAHHPMRIANQRHMLVNCDTVDKDPLVDDMAVISGCGTDLGIDFQGQYGVVTNRSRFSQYYHPRLDERGQPVVIVRKYVGNAREYGMFLFLLVIYSNYYNYSDPKGPRYWSTFKYAALFVTWISLFRSLSK